MWWFPPTEHEEAWKNIQFSQLMVYGSYWGIISFYTAVLTSQIHKQILVCLLRQPLSKTTGTTVILIFPLHHLCILVVLNCDLGTPRHSCLSEGSSVSLKLYANNLYTCTFLHFSREVDQNPPQILKSLRTPVMYKP